ncbi:MAG: 30S ribosomal protein S17 [Gemmataceae bacterium]
MADQPTTSTKATTPVARKQRRKLTGVVTRDKMDKTRRVEFQYLVKHVRYNKYIKRRTICYVHDEKNETKIGDTVEIMETRPLSKTKCWRLVRVVKKAPLTATEAAPIQ